MRKLLITVLYALAAWVSLAQETNTNLVFEIPLNSRFYSWRHPDWPPAPLPPDSSLKWVPLRGGGPGDFLVNDLDYDYPSDFGPQLQVFPIIHLDTNVLAGNTQEIAFWRTTGEPEFLSKVHLRTNDLRLIEHRKQLNELFDWLEKQPRQTPTNYYPPVIAQSLVLPTNEMMLYGCTNDFIFSSLRELYSFHTNSHNPASRKLGDDALKAISEIEHTATNH